MKKIISVVLALTMILGSAAMAAELPEGWTPADGARAGFSTQIILNNEELNTVGLPSAGKVLMVPMRLLCESDGGFADWFQEENQGFFFMANNNFVVNFADMSVELNGEVMDGVTATVVSGVTYLPAAAVSKAEGVKVTSSSDRVTVTTPNGAPLVKLAREILSQVNCGASMQASMSDMVNSYGFNGDNLDELTAFLPMMTNPDTLIIAKAKEGKTDGVKADLETYRKMQEDTFSWYLVDNLPKVQNAKVVTSGSYVMLYIGENADVAESLFLAGVKSL